ncbi:MULTISPECIES: hypothetical protein [Rhizobium]|nr:MULTISPECIES: hypothetical protein [Rhizobium]
MQTNTSMTPKTAAPQTIPADVLARLENEWRQVRQPSSRPSGK